MSATWIATSLSRLLDSIAAGNQKGNVEGLLSRLVLENDPRLGLQWIVDCDEKWVRADYDPSNLGHVAALAYTIEHGQGNIWRPELEAGLQRASARDPKTAGLGSALHDPGVLIGLCVGSKLLGDRSTDYAAWCISVIRTLIASGPRRADPMWAYALQICNADPVSLHIDPTAPLTDRAALDWWLRKPGNGSNVDIRQLTQLRQSIVEEVLSEAHEHIPAHQAALLWRCLKEAVSQVAADALQAPLDIAHALRQFQSGMKRWRWDREDLQKPIRWPIRSEREVQDILWLLLRSIAPDVEDEDTLPKFGHSTYKADFGISRLGLLIEAKFARSATDFKSIEKEILEDLVPYLRAPERYREVLVFIYDDSCSVQNHDTTIRALRSVGGISDVIIACRPSQLPPISEQNQ